MNSETILARAIDFVRSTLNDNSAGHDWFHVERVWRVAKSIAETEDADRLTVELAALLHDIGDWKFHGGDDSAGPRIAGEWLYQQGVDETIIRHVCDIIARLSFRGAGVPTPMPTLEGRIVQDADRLDAIGAIGVARAFAYGGHKGRLMYDPESPPEMHQSFDAYKKNSGPTINHFYEKLLLLKDRMNTRSAKTIAEQRHQFMQEFLEQFYEECGTPPWHAWPA